MAWEDLDATGRDADRVGRGGRKATERADARRRARSEAQADTELATPQT
jgi:hypothetical protein